MGVIIFIVLVALVLSLYDFFSSRDINRLTSDVAAEKNQKYGAYAIQRSYNIILASIVAGFVILFVAFVGIERGFGWGTGAMLPKIQKIDTFMLTLNAPPIEHNETLPPSYKLNGKEGSGTPQTASNAQPEPEQQEAAPKPEPRKAPENPTAGEKPMANTEKPIKNKSKVSSAEQQVLDLEKQYLAESGGEQKRAEIRRKAEEDKKRREDEKRKNTPPPSKQTTANEGGNNGAKGKTMVNFDLDGRTPHNNDIWFIRNPGYTCGQGLGGEIVVKIKVNANGDVISAEPTGNLGGINPCLIQQAREYARKSRFNASSIPSQEGTITYRFVP